jgi:serine phosphatase RsbU (regulator of sigma subunit)
VLRPASGARVYLATDGVLDHPGGARGHGLGTDRFMALLAGLAGVPLGEQRARLVEALGRWAGGRPQRDDLTILGFQVDWRG